jgi:ABC-type lipoprotein release transport system permease subunit
MKVPWPLYLAWKQLFPSGKKVSFFSLLSIIGVALGVNVMIVVIAFMQGFQQKFRKDIINAQGHARVVPLRPYADWREIPSRLRNVEDVEGVTPYLQAQLLLQNGNYHAIPFCMGLQPEDGDEVLPIGDFLKGGMSRLQAHDADDVTPLPTMDSLEDEIVFLSSQAANRLGVRPAAVVQVYEENATLPKSTRKGGVKVTRLDSYVESGEWEILFKSQGIFAVKESISGDEFSWEVAKGPFDLGFGYPLFATTKGEVSFEPGDRFLFQVFKASSLEVFSPSMIEQAKADELVPPREVRVGGIFEVPWQGFQMEALIGTMRFMEDMRADEGTCDGFYLKFSGPVARDEVQLQTKCRELELILEEDWAVVPWFVENAWFFELLKFEEYLMVLIMIPIGLVAAFSIAIALMTTVLRKIREIGLLVAMGGRRISVGMVFCLQGFIIGMIGAIFGCGLAILFIRYREVLMTFIVEKIAGRDGQAGVAQFYDFHSLEVPFPWESSESLSTFLSFALFSILVSTVAGLLPAWRATRLNPADALRSE